jgi:3'-5' exoribonuclease
MGRRFVDQLRDGDSFDEIYLVIDKQLKANRNGAPFIQVELRDRTGHITARFWNAGENVFRSFDNGDYVRVEGKSQLFQGSLQVILEHIERAEPKFVDSQDFLPKTEQDIPKLFEKLRVILMKMANPHLRALAECFLMDDAFVSGFTTAPAGVKLHHAFIGGLLEHTVGMMEMAEKLLPHYPGTDRDLVMIGLFLHDSGKVRELSYLRAFGYTDEGQLLGHIPMAVEMVTEQVAKVVELLGEPFPRDLLLRIKHMILSHHGTMEHGSPKVPMTPEAMLLHCIDSMDTRMHMVLRELKDDRNNPTAWTPYNSNLQRRFYKGGANGGLIGGSGDSYD